MFLQMCYVSLYGKDVKMKTTKTNFGTTRTGEDIFLYHLENNNGAYVDITNLGARIVKIVVPNRDHILTDVCLGLPSGEAYETDNAYLGAIAGRVANRIKDGRFTLEDTEYSLAINCGSNHLHGGLVGFSFKLWDAELSDNKLVLTLHSPDGEEGYPGNLTLQVTYSWSEDNELSILYEATTDKTTLLNVTNHAYFNLDGANGTSVLSHELFIDADSITELDASQAPNGNFLSVEGTPFDFRELHTIEKYMSMEHPQLQTFGTYDHNFVINGSGLREAAVLQSKKSGIRLTCFTDEPGMQLYVPKDMMDFTATGGIRHEKYASVCLETQHYPDAINHPNFPSIVLKPAENFRSKTIYHFSNF